MGGHLREKSEAANYPGRGQRSTLGGMQTEAPEQTTAAPIKAAPSGARKPLRLPTPHQGRLREAKLDLAAKFRIETTENLILEQFFEEAFEPWLRAKLSEKKAK